MQQRRRSAAITTGSSCELVSRGFQPERCGRPAEIDAPGTGLDHANRMDGGTDRALVLPGRVATGARKTRWKYVPYLQLNHRALLPVVITVVLIVGSVLSLIHAQHLRDRDHGDTSTARSMMNHANISDVVSDVPASNTMDCPAPEWNLPPQPDVDVTPLDIACIAAWPSAAGQVTRFVVPQLVIPVARGPDLQAELQRFTL